MSLTASTKTHKPTPKHPISLESSFTDWQQPLPKKTLNRLQQAPPAAAWEIWKKYLVNRKTVTDLSHLLPVSNSPLAWSANISLQRDETLSFLSQITNFSRSTKHTEATETLLIQWLSTTPAETTHSAEALQTVACAWSLSELSQLLDAELWWGVLERLVSTAADALQLDVVTHPLPANLLGGELPLVLAYYFPELKSTSDLSSLAIEFLSEALVEILDGEGMPKANYLPFFGPLLGSWTRCRAIIKHRSKLSWSDDAEGQYRWMITQAVRMSRGQGGFAFGINDNLLADRDLLLSAVELGGNRSDAIAADSILGRKKRDADKPLAIDASYHSEWAAVGLLRSKLTKKSRQLSVTYEKSENQIELAQGNSVVFAGELASQLTLDKTVGDGASRNDWEQVAWESDTEVDYLEIEKDISPHTRLQRSFLLARSDQFLLVADAVISRSDMPIHHRIDFPLGDGMTVDSEQGSWELTLKDSQTRARVLPLGLPEWKAGCRHGSLQVKRRSLRIEQTGHTRLFVPLFIDLSPKRAGKKLTWRRLSIGENRRNLSPDVAVGYRVQIGREQWLIYRSLDRPTPRTVLGQNLLCEFHVSRFLPSGDAESLIEVQ